MAGRPRKKQRVQEEFSFTNFEAKERTENENYGNEEAHLDVAMSDEWNQEAEECFRFGSHVVS